MLKMLEELETTQTFSNPFGLDGNQLYGMFWAKSIRHLTRTNGQVSFITGDTLLSIKTHKELRKILLNKTKIEYCMKLGNWFFTFNNNWTCLMTVTTTKSNPLMNSAIYLDGTKVPKNDYALNLTLNSWKNKHIGIENLPTTKKHESRCIEIDNELYAIGRYSVQQSINCDIPHMPLFHTAPIFAKYLSYKNLVTTANISKSPEYSQNNWKDNLKGWDVMLTQIKKFECVQLMR